MSLLEKLLILQKILDQSLKVEISRITGNITITIKQESLIQYLLEQAELDYVNLAAGKFEINTSIFPQLFLRKEDFKIFDLTTFSEQVAILFYNKIGFLLFDPENQETYNKYGIVETEPFFVNCYFCALTLDDFKKNEVFAYDNVSNYNLVLHSMEYGVLIVNYRNLLPITDREIHYKDNYINLKSNEIKKEFSNCLKIHVAEFFSKTSEPYYFSFLIEHLGEILDEARKSYEIFVSGFSFSKLIGEFRQEKEKYFSSIRDVLSGIMNKTVTIPISISAAALAIHDLKTEPQFGTLVLIAFLVYTVFTSYLLKISYQEVDEIDASIQEDQLKIAAAIKAPLRDTANDKVAKKISTARFCIVLVQIILALLAICSIYFTWLIFTPIQQNVVLFISIIAVIHIMIISWTVSSQLKKMFVAHK